ncbi:MAG: hypothetical protein J5666_07220 [Bacilli bacterium]|nr:hypothetical protein [Bacilli bacterium]
MKKIKSILAKIKAKATLTTYQKPFFVTILTLLLINLLVLIMAGVLGLILDNYTEYNNFNGNFFSAFGSALTWMISPNSINTLIGKTDSIADNIQVIILAVLVIAIEMILFSGAIIATLTAAIKGFIDKKSQAKGKIILDNHFVILNWNTKVPDMIYNLLCKKYKGSILILSNKDKEYITTEIESVISANQEKKEKNKIHLIIKEGNPLLHGSLEDISIDKASNIVIMSREDMTVGDDENITNYDLYSLKIMLALGNFNINPKCNIVVETDDYNTKQKIENLSKTIKTLQNKSIIPVSFNRKIGQIIAQTVISPELANIYLELLSFEGSEFYSIKGNSVEEFFASHSDAIPIIKFDKLFVLAEDESDINKLRNKKLEAPRTLITKEEKEIEDFTVFVIGENKKTKHIIDNLNLASISIGSHFKVRDYHKNETSKLINDIKNTQGIKKVLVISDDTVTSDSYDANVFVTLIALQNAFPKREELSYITELLDSRNLHSVKDFNIKNAIISNRMMSLLLTQLALNSDSKRFYEGLLTIDTTDGGEFFDVKIEKVKNMLDINQDLSFKSRGELIHSFYESFHHEYMLIGYITNDEIIFLNKNQDVENEITLKPNDKLIYIDY